MKKNDTERIRQLNRKQIIDYLRVHGPIARVDLGQALNLSPATVTAITSNLDKESRLMEVTSSEKTTGRGRPRVLIDLAPKAVHVLGFKLSINELQVMLGNQKGQIVKQEVIELQTRELSEEGLVEAIASTFRTFSAGLSNEEKPRAVGVAVQGVVNGNNGEVIWSPALAQKHLSLREQLERLIQIPVTVANDANCLTIALRHQPEYQQLKDFTVVMLGYGVGMGMVLNGELYKGHHGAAAEFGHTKYNPEGAQCLCGKRGCVEAYISDYALFRDAQTMVSLPSEERLHPTEELMMSLVNMADSGSEEIKDLFERAGQILGHALSNVVALLSPEKIIISGPGIRAFEHMKGGLDRSLRASLVQELMADTHIESKNWNEDITIQGVIALALQTVD